MKKEDKSKNLIDLLRKNRLRLTPQRIVILNILSEADKHLSADNIYREAKKKYPMLSATTVYRNLESMVDAGFISCFKYGETALRYNTNTDEHHHFICTKCGKIHDAYLKEINYELDWEKSSLDKVKIDTSELYLHGICGDCLVNLQ